MIAVLFLCGIAGSGFLFFIHFRAAAQVNAAKRWPVAPAQVLAAEVRQSGSYDHTQFQPLVHYRYLVNGQEFQGTTLRFGATHGHGPKKAAAMIAPYPPGAAISVRYNPQQPHQSVLELASPSPIYLILAVVVAAGFIGIPLLALAG